MADIRLAKPAAGATQSVPCEPDARFVFDFPTTDATLAREGDNLNIRFEDGSNLELQGFYEQYNEENLPSFNIDGTEVAAADFFQAMNEPDLMPAAGPGTGTAANGARFHEWGDSSLASGLTHLDGLDVSFSRSFEWDDTPNAVGYTHDDDGPGAPGNTVPGIDVPVPPEPGRDDEGDHFVAAQGGNIVVDEGALTGGSGQHTAHGAKGEGAFTVDVHGEKGGTIELACGDDVLVLDIPLGGATSIPVPEDAPVFHINGVDITIREVTSNGNGKWTVSYDYELTGNIRHDQDANEDTVKFGEEDLSITVTDGSGDVAHGKLTVEVHDDVPVIDHVQADAAVSFTNEDGSGSSQLTGTFSLSFGADGKAGADALQVEYDGEVKTLSENSDGTWSTQIGGGTLTLTPGADGWTYNFEPADATKTFSKDFTILVTDSDGDTAHAEITVSQNYKSQVLGSDPGKPDADGAKIVVDEGEQPDDPAHEGAHSQTGSGQFYVDLHGEDGTITLSFGDDKVELNVKSDGSYSFADGADHVLTVNGVEITFTGATLGEDGKWSVEYSYALKGAQQHGAAGSDNAHTLGGKIDIEVADTTNPDTPSTGSITVEVHDDVPVIGVAEADEATNLTHEDGSSGSSQLTGKFSLSFGADGKADADALQVKYDGEVTTMKDDGKGSFTAEVAGGTLTLTQGTDGWTYSFEPADSTATFSKDFTIIAKDSDGDTDETDISVSQKYTPDTGHEKPGDDYDGHWANGGSIVVDEGALENGSGGANATHGYNGEGAFTVRLHGGGGTVTIGEGDDTVKFTVVKGEDGTFTVEGEGGSVTMAGVTVIFDANAMSQNTDGSWSVRYSYELGKSQTHTTPNGNVHKDMVGGDIPITVTDSNEEVVSDKLTVEVHDDAPVFDTVTSSGEVDFTSGPANFSYTFDADHKFSSADFSMILNQGSTGSVNIGLNGPASHLVGNGTTVNFTITGSIVQYQYERGEDGTLRVTDVANINSTIKNTGKGIEITGNGLAMASGRETPWNAPNGEFSAGAASTGKDYLSLTNNGSVAAANVSEAVVFDLNDIAYGIELDLGSFTKGDRVLVTFLMTPPNNDDDHIEQMVEITYGDLQNGLVKKVEGTESTYRIEMPNGFTKVFVSAVGSSKYTLDSSGNAHLEAGQKETSGFTIKGVEFLKPQWQQDGQVHATSADGGISYTWDQTVFPKEVDVQGYYAGRYGLDIKPALDAGGKEIANSWVATLKDGPTDYNGSKNYNGQTLFQFSLDPETGKWHFTQYYEFTSAGDATNNPLFTITATDADGDTTSTSLDLNGQFVRFDEVRMGHYNKNDNNDVTKDVYDDVLIGADNDSLMYGKGGDDLVLGDRYVAAEDGVDDAAVKAVLTTIGQQTDGFKGTTNSVVDKLYTAIKGLHKDGKLDDLSSALEKHEGQGGSDLIYGGVGNDILLGMKGDDALYGEKGEDFLFGGSGNDFLHGGADKDYLLGGSGDDILVYDKDDYLIDGGEGIDILLAGRNDSSLSLADMPETVKNIEVLLLAENTSDVTTLGITGLKSLANYGVQIVGEGDDRTIELSANWVFAGTDEKGNQIYTYEDGKVSLRLETSLAAKHDVYIMPESGNDQRTGGTGDDVIFGYNVANVAGLLTVLGLQGNASQEAIAAAIRDNPQAVADYLAQHGATEGAYSNVAGNAGDDYLFGQNAGDALMGDGDAKSAVIEAIGVENYKGIGDALSALQGADHKTLGNIADQLEKTVETKVDKPDDGNDQIFAGGGTDMVYGGGGNDTIDGGAGDDILIGGSGDDTLLGGDGDDFLFGGSGDDFLDGGAGADTIFGGSGNDLIVYDKDDYLIDGGADIDVLLAGLNDPSLKELTDSNKVNDVEVLIKGANTLDITSMEDLADKLGIQIKGDSMTLDKEWVLKGTENGIAVFEKDGVTLETSLEINPDSGATAEAEQAAFTLSNSQG